MNISENAVELFIQLERLILGTDFQISSIYDQKSISETDFYQSLSEVIYNHQVSEDVTNERTDEPGVS